VSKPISSINLKILEAEMKNWARTRNFYTTTTTMTSKYTKPSTVTYQNQKCQNQKCRRTSPKLLVNQNNKYKAENKKRQKNEQA
jgi:hypothetical protein